MNFVKGQKLEWVDYDGLALYNIGKIYTFKRYIPYPDGIHYVQTEEIGADSHYPERFKTIIQSIDDVIPGMELTHNFRGKVKIVEVCHQPANCYVISYKFDGSTWYTQDIINFKEYKPKEKVMCEKEYKVVGDGFSILDIYRKRPNCGIAACFNSWFGLLLREEDIRNFRSKHKYVTMRDVKASAILIEELPWLEEKGFIKEVEMDIILEKGMILKNDCSNKLTYRVVDVGEGRIMLLVVENDFMFGHGEIWLSGATLSLLNSYDDSIFEVISG